MRILVVDDSADNLRLFQTILENNKYEVTTALNGEEALQILRDTPADLILSDILMPVMDGFRFLQECKADAKLQKIPFIFITGAFLDKKDEDLALKMGVVAFVRKPVELDSLISLVEEVLSQVKSKKKPKKPAPEKAVIEKEINISVMEKLQARMQELEEEIAERKKAESALRQAEAEFRLLFDTMEQGVAYLDAKGNIISVNAAAERILGLPKNQLLCMSNYDPRWRAIREDGTDFPGNAHPTAVATSTGKPVRDVVMGIFNLADDKYHWIKINAIPQFRPGEESAYQVCATFDDITDRFLTFKALQEHESRLNAILENTTDAIASINRDYIVTAANESALKMLGMVVGPFEVGSNIHELLPPERRAFWDNIFIKALGGQNLLFENHYDLDKGPLDIEFSVSPISSPSGKITGISFFGRNITERRQMEEAVKKANRLYKMLYECNEAVVQANSEQQLLQHICNVMVETGGYLMVWIGFAENDEKKTVRPVAHCGSSEHYLESADITWADDMRGSGPTGKAIRSGNTIVNQDISTNPDFIPWLEDAKKEGFAASAAFPLKSYWQTIGALNVYSSATDAFNQDEVSLLEQLAADLAYGITSLRERRQREHAEEALTESEQRFRKAAQSTTDIVWDWNIESGQVDWFGDIDGMLSYGQAEFPRTLEAWEKQLHPDDHDRVIAALNHHAQTGEPYNVEYRIRRKDGSIRYWIDRGLVLRDRDGNIIRSIGACVDITDHRLEDARARIRRDLAITLAATVDLNLALQQSLDAAIKIAGMESGVIYLLDDESGDYKSVYYRNVSEPTMEIFSILKANSEDAHLLARGTPIYVTASQFTPRYETPFKSEGWTFTATLPVMHEGKAVACFIVCSHHMSGLPDTIRNSLETIAADISGVIERIRSIKALQSSEERYRFITDHTRDVIWVLDKDLHYTYVSPSITLQRGYTADEFMAFNLSQIATTESMEKAINIVLGNVPGDITDINDGTYTSTMELEVYRKDGTTYWTEQSATVLMTPEGQFAGILGISRDITERKKLESELREREAMFRVVFEHHYQFTGLLDSEGRLLAVNNTALQFAGITEKNVIGKYFWETPWWQHSTEVQQQLKEAIGRAASGEFIHFDTSNINARGEIHQIDFTMNPVLDEAGKVKYMIPEGRDITEVVKTQKALKESEEKYRLLVKNANEGIFVAQDGLFKFANARVWAISGYSSEELGTQSFGQFIHPEDRNMVMDKHARRLQGEIFEDNYPFRIITKEGKTAWIEVGAILSEWEGRPAILGFMTDITERKQAEDALRDSEEKYRQLVETANEVMFVVQDMKIKFFNRRAVEVIGYSADELKNMPFAKLVYPDDLEMVADGHRRRLQGEPFEHAYPFRYVLKSGAVGWAEINTTLISWEGRPATLSFLSDITERKQAEDALRDSEEKYRAVVENAREGVVVLQGESVKFTNQYISDLLGYSKDFILSHPFLDYIHPDDRLTVIERYMQRLAGERIMDVLTARLLASNGSYVWTEIRAVVIVWGGEPATLNFVTDITESRKIQADLKNAVETITSTLEGTMEAVAMMSELRDPYTAGHQKMVTHLALAIAQEMQLPEDRQRALRVAGLLHDVGKVYVPSEILSKPGKLSELERDLAKAHASAGYDIVKAIKFPWPVDEMVRQHHERMDGSGYPRGLKGDEIMLEARILAVADTVEAMMSHRPYRAALGVEKALDEIVQNKGVLYDETVVDTCVLLFIEKGFKFPE